MSATKRPMTKPTVMLTLAAFLMLLGCADPSGQTGNDGVSPALQAGAQSATDAAPESTPIEAGQAPTPPTGDAAAGEVVAPPPPDAVVPDSDAPAAEGNTDADVDLAIDTLLADHTEYRKVFDRLQQAVASDDRAGVASLVVYPLEVHLGGKSRKIRNAKEFMDAWDGIMVPEVKDVITKQRYRDVFVNWQGMMFGDGQVWINGICQDKACKKVDVGVTAIQQAAQ